MTRDVFRIVVAAAVGVRRPGRNRRAACSWANVSDAPRFPPPWLLARRKRILGHAKLVRRASLSEQRACFPDCRLADRNRRRAFA
jgi:hypothetical protein